MHLFCSEELDTELKSETSLLARIDAVKQTLQQTSNENTHSAMEEYAEIVC